MNISIIGTGYVGLVTGISLASAGNKVICVGRNADKIIRINSGEIPFYEPGLKKLLQNALKRNSFSASTNLQESVTHADTTIIAVGTPTVDNAIDLTEIKNVSKQIGTALRTKKAYHVVAVKSTVIPKTTERVVIPILKQYSGKKLGEFGVCMNPEFLREGNAVSDAMNPDRVVIGRSDEKSGTFFAAMYKKFKCPVLFTNLRTAEMIKYTSNSFFASTISFSNEIARICEEAGGIDVTDVWKGVHLDRRIAASTGFLHYLYSGCGYGGSCFPKDTKALLGFAKSLGVKTDVLKSVIEVNASQPQRLMTLLKKRLPNLKGKKVAILGLSFKPDTDDLRESPALAVIELLTRENAVIVCHDPIVYKDCTRPELNTLAVRLADTVEDALKGADAALLLTAWDEYQSLTPGVFKKTMKRPLLVDGRRMLSKDTFTKAGIDYLGIGFIPG